MAKSTGSAGRTSGGGAFRVGQRITDGLVVGRITSVGSIRYGRGNLPAYRVQTSNGGSTLIIADQARRARR